MAKRGCVIVITATLTRPKPQKVLGMVIQHLCGLEVSLVQLQSLFHILSLLGFFSASDNVSRHHELVLGYCSLLLRTVKHVEHIPPENM